MTKSILNSLASKHKSKYDLIQSVISYAEQLRNNQIQLDSMFVSDSEKEKLKAKDKSLRLSLQTTSYCLAQMQGY